MTIDKIELDVLLAQKLIDGARQLFEEMAPSNLRMQDQSRCHAHTVRKRRGKSFQFKFLFTFEPAVAPENHPRARHGDSLFGNIKMIGPFIPFIAKLARVRIGLAVSALAVHLFDIHLISKAINVFLLRVGRGHSDLERGQAFGVQRLIYIANDRRIRTSLGGAMPVRMGSWMRD